MHLPSTACEEKENNLIGDPRQLQMEIVAFRFLSQQLDKAELERYEDRGGCPRNTFPETIFKAYMDAEESAKQLISLKATNNEVEKLILETKRKLHGKIDPYLVLILLEWFHHYSSLDSILAAKKSFTLTARLVMDAPFMLATNNALKRGFGSFPYFAHCADNFEDMIVAKKDGSSLVVDTWQIYFFDDSYPIVMPWLLPLYDFYWREAWYIENTVDPFSDENWPILKKKITSKDRFYDDDWIKSKKLLTKSYKTAFHLYDDLDEYLIKDLNIYWRLLPKLAGLDALIQDDFVNTMLDAGADPSTIVDAKGNTARDLARDSHLRIETLEASAPKSQGAESMPTSHKRKPLTQLDNQSKRSCKNLPVPKSGTPKGKGKKPTTLIPLDCNETVEEDIL